MWKIFIQLILGLQSLHSNNIFVKYFSLKNIFLDNENNIKIGGINYFLDFSNENKEDENINDKSNIFSLGCILYELIFKKPYKNFNFDFSENCEENFKKILPKLLCNEKNRIKLNEILYEPIIKNKIIEINLFDEIIIKNKIKSKNLLLIFLRL